MCICLTCDTTTMVTMLCVCSSYTPARISSATEPPQIPLHKRPLRPRVQPISSRVECHTRDAPRPTVDTLTGLEMQQVGHIWRLMRDR